MEKKLINGNELKDTRHGIEDNMTRQTSVCMCIPNHACMRHMGSKQGCKSYSKGCLSLMRKDY